eukprot:358684-Chlamydomonas_euryale.AAC.2
MPTRELWTAAQGTDRLVRWSTDPFPMDMGVAGCLQGRHCDAAFCFVSGCQGMETCCVERQQARVPRCGNILCEAVTTSTDA